MIEPLDAARALREARRRKCDEALRQAQEDIARAEVVGMLGLAAGVLALAALVALALWVPL